MLLICLGTVWQSLRPPPSRDVHVCLAEATGCRLNTACIQTTNSTCLNILALSCLFPYVSSSNKHWTRTSTIQKPRQSVAYVQFPTSSLNTQLAGSPLSSRQRELAVISGRFCRAGLTSPFRAPAPAQRAGPWGWLALFVDVRSEENNNKTHNMKVPVKSEKS